MYARREERRVSVGEFQTGLREERCVQLLAVEECVDRNCSDKMLKPAAVLLCPPAEERGDTEMVVR